MQYLLQLARHVESLYEGDMLAVIEDIPALLQELRIVQEISRHYNDPRIMLGLIQKVTAQMIKNCRRCILGDARGIWDLEALIPKLPSASP